MVGMVTLLQWFSWSLSYYFEFYFTLRQISTNVKAFDMIFFNYFKNLFLELKTTPTTSPIGFECCSLVTLYFLKEKFTISLGIYRLCLMVTLLQWFSWSLSYYFEFYFTLRQISTNVKAFDMIFFNYFKNLFLELKTTPTTSLIGFECCSLVTLYFLVEKFTISLGIYRHCLMVTLLQWFTWSLSYYFEFYFTLH